jgi:hypothetical protein
MPLNFRHHTALLSFTLALACVSAHAQDPSTPAQQVIQSGALSAPTGVLTQTGQWSSLIPILSNADVALYIEDPSNDDWLAHNAENFINRRQYTITLVSFYKTRRPCREDEIAAGFSDAAHINACDSYRYRIRQVAVDTRQHTLTLLYSAMVSSAGTLDPASARTDTRTGGSAGLNADAQKALAETTKLVAEQSHIYDARQRNIP